MPDLKTGLLTYPEFQEAISGRTGTVFLFDIQGQGAGSLDGAKETGDWAFGDWQFMVLVDHISGDVTPGAILGRVGGDKFAAFLDEFNAPDTHPIWVDDWQHHLTTSPVKVHWGKGSTVIEADADMKRRRNKYPPRTMRWRP